MSIKNKRTAILGSTGYIGSYLLKRFQKLDKSTIGLSKDNDFDLSQSSTWVFEPNLKYAIICAAKTSLKLCEKDPRGSSFINVRQTFKLVRYLISLKVVPIVFSSDYVFDGISGNYSENSLTNPLNEYGMQKNALEKILLNRFHDKCIILRLSKVYGGDFFHNTFVSEILKLLANKKDVKAACDQIFCPIHLEDIFQTIYYIQNKNLKGLFNLCGAEAFQRYQLAILIANQFGFDPTLVKKIYLKNLGENFKRPFNTSMVSKKLDLTKISSIKENLKKLHKEYERKGSMAKNCRYVRQ